MCLHVYNGTRCGFEEAPTDFDGVADPGPDAPKTAESQTGC